MKKTISISLFVTILAAGLFTLVIFLLPETDEIPKEVRIAETQTEEMPEEYAESMTINEPYEYLIKGKDGFLVVFQKDGKTLLFETNIRISNLDREVVDKLENGICFSTEKELYDFLESYSS